MVRSEIRDQLTSWGTGSWNPIIYKVFFAPSKRWWVYRISEPSTVVLTISRSGLINSTCDRFFWVNLKCCEANSLASATTKSCLAFVCSHTGFIPKLLRLKYQVIWLNTQKYHSHPHLFHQLFTTLWFFKHPFIGPQIVNKSSSKAEETNVQPRHWGKPGVSWNPIMGFPPFKETGGANHLPHRWEVAGTLQQTWWFSGGFRWRER